MQQPKLWQFHDLKVHRYTPCIAILNRHRETNQDKIPDFDKLPFEDTNTLRMCMCIYITCVQTLYICMYIGIKYKYISQYVCMHVRMDGCQQECMHLLYPTHRLFTCVHTCIYIYICIYIYMYIIGVGFICLPKYILAQNQRSASKLAVSKKQSISRR